MTVVLLYEQILRINRSNIAKHVTELGKSSSSLVAPGGTLKEGMVATIKIMYLRDLHRAFYVVTSTWNE